MSNLISIIDDTGYERFLGNLEEPDTELLKSWPVFGEANEIEIIPEAEWGDWIAKIQPGPEAPFLTYVHDQDGIGMCNCSATNGAMESTRLRKGLPHVPLSGGDLYRRISGGSDNGSTLQAGIRAAMNEGVAPVSIVPYLDWTRSHPGAAESRKNYRVLEAFLLPTKAHVMTAAIKGFYLISGIPWYPNFRTDGDGWLPARGSGRSGGHAVFGYKPAMRQTSRGVQYGVWHQNSWSTQWGVAGRCVFPMDLYTSQIGGWWAVGEVVDEGGVVPPLVA